MVTFTTNKALSMPLVGGDTGVWGQPLNNNSSILDQSLGGSATIPLSSVAGAITLLASNYLNSFLSFTGTLTQNTIVTLPAVGSFYTVQNLTVAASQFTVTLQTTAAGSQVLGCPPFQPQDIFTDGSNVKFRGLPHVGAYWDYAGTAVPNWVTACTVKPWLNCDGTTFSSATYPYLATILGSTTLPDSRGRFRGSLNQGTGRITTAAGGLDGNTLSAGGGVQATAIATSHIPSSALVDNNHSHLVGVFNGPGTPGSAGIQGTANANNTNTPGGQALIGPANISFGSTAPTAFPTVPPGYIGGITMIRSG